MSFLSDWREPWNGRKDSKVAIIGKSFTLGFLCQYLIADQFSQTISVQGANWNLRIFTGMSGYSCNHLR
jgi:hypothetical protein